MSTIVSCQVKEMDYTLGPHLVIWPGLFITITVLCLYIIGDGLRDALDPTMRGVR